MMHPEEEAKERWCPMARSIQGYLGPPCICNRDAAGIPFPKCIGSDCMMWRWEISPEHAAQVNARSNLGWKEKGYCGLAGKP